MAKQPSLSPAATLEMDDFFYLFSFLAQRKRYITATNKNPKQDNRGQQRVMAGKMDGPLSSAAFEFIGVGSDTVDELVSVFKKKNYTALSYCNPLISDTDRKCVTNRQMAPHLSRFLALASKKVEKRISHAVQRFKRDTDE